MIKTMLSVGLLAASLLCGSAQAEFVVEITHGQADAIPIAIVPFSLPQAAATSFES